MEEFQHEPVLPEEVLRWLSPALGPGLTLVDCTSGGAGHARALLRALDGLRLIGLDRDAAAIAAATERLRPFGDRVRLVRSDFSALTDVLERLGVEAPAGVLYDLGVSSPQLDHAERGFRYRGDAPLDMRMDRSQPLTAADVVNGYDERRLARVIGTLGEERFAGRIARAIVRRRAERPFSGTEDLAAVVRDAIPAATRRTGPHPARRTFQAIRIEVNGELDALRASLPAAIGALRPTGRVAVISYHSLEDRIVKRTFADAARGCRCPPDVPVCVCGRIPEVRLLTRRPVRPGPEEIAANPRADSARLRVAEKLAPGEAA
ncbi:MAG: 16S rRNA (cytosine(1402)-N(4))-methyltransferase RsmH [Actinomycetota bacterium]